MPQISPINDARALRRLTEQLIAGGYDVVHTHSAKAGALGRVAAGRAGVPRVVHTYHGFPFHEFQSRVRRGAYISVERSLPVAPTYSWRSAPRSLLRPCARAWQRPERVRVINPAIDRPASTATPALRAAARTDLGVPVGCKVVGTVGRVDYQKAPECFVDAIAALDRPDVYAVWIGDGPMRQRMVRRAARLGLGGRFVCTGHRDDVALSARGAGRFRHGQQI